MGTGRSDEINRQTGATTTYLYGIRNAHQLHAETLDGELQLWIPDFQTNELVLISQRSIQKIAGELQGPWGIVAYNGDFLVTDRLPTIWSRSPVRAKYKSLWKTYVHPLALL
jgi:uncharacterized membrane protein